MTPLVLFLIAIALAVWIFAAEWTVTGIESDPMLWEPWYRLPRGIRIVLILLAWPLVAFAAFVILTKANHHG